MDSEEHGFRALPLTTGVYEILHLRAGTNDRIVRAGGTDCEGILYVGRAKGSNTLRSRIRLFWAAANECSDWPANRKPTYNDVKKAHSGGNTYVLCGFRRLYPLNELWVRWAEDDEPSASEVALIQNYAWEFLDRPPLNSTMSRQRWT